MNKLLGGTISRKLQLLSLLVTLLTATGLSVLKVYIDHQNLKQHVKNNLEIIANTFQEKFIDEIWNKQYDEAKQTLATLVELPDVDYATLRVYPNVDKFGAKPTTDDFVEQRIQLKKQTGGMPFYLGELVLQRELGHIEREGLYPAISTFLVNLALVFFIAVIYGVLYRKIVTNRLFRLASIVRDLTKFDIEYGPLPAGLKKKRVNGDELDEMENAVSLLWETASEAIEEWRGNERRWRFAVDSSNQGLWDYDCNDNHVYFSTNWKRLLGYDKEEIDTSLDEWFSRIHPNERDDCINEFQRHLFGQNDRFEYTHQLLCKSGEYRTFIVRGRVVEQNDNGLPKRVLGLLADITELKESEQQLKIAATAFEQASEGMLITDKHNRIISVNRAFTAITGYQSEEVIGLPPSILRSGRQSPEFYERMWQSLRQTGQWQGEIWNKNKAGQEYAEWLTISRILDESGDVERHVAMFSDITHKKQQEELISYQANYDFLTDLPNRRLFLEILTQLIKQAQREHHQLWLLYLDLDEFKEVNDTLGHDAGDVLLVKISKRIRATLRKSDHFARLGGDEFAIILNGIDKNEDVELLVEKLIVACQKPVQIEHEFVEVSASIGIVNFPNDADSPDELMKRADQTMYKAKQMGKNQHVFFTNDLQNALIQRQELTKKLRLAIDNNELETFFQPVVNLVTGKIKKAEALIRWHHPLDGWISPAIFIPLAESNRLIVNITELVIDQSIAALTDWKTIDPDMSVGINMSPVILQSATKAHNDVIQKLLDVDLPKESLKVEITEGSLLEKNQLTESLLLMFRDHGIEVAIDDFGTGYSSLAYLNRFHIDFLKIDISFVRGIENNRKNRALCEAIIVMAHKLDIRVIAEGVETVEQMQILRDMGCDYGQGYLFSRPIPAEQFRALLLDNDTDHQPYMVSVN